MPSGGGFIVTRTLALLAAALPLLLLALPGPSAAAAETTPTVSFATAAQSVPENASDGRAHIVFELSAPATQRVSVPFTISGNAVGGGRDYSMPTSPFEIAAPMPPAAATLAERIHAHLHAPESELRREVAEGQVDGDAVREASLEDAVAAEGPPEGTV